jgi:hypothetical protein
MLPIVETTRLSACVRMAALRLCDVYGSPTGDRLVEGD